MKTGIYWQNPAYPAKGMDFIFDPSLVLYLPLYRLDGVSFRSKDAYGHLCTVVGALWRPSGHYFDGTDDIINCGTALSLSPANITITVWIKTSRASQDVVHRYIAAGDQRAYSFYIDGAKLGLAVTSDGTAGTGTAIAGDTAVNGDVWTYVTATSDGSNLNLYVNGVVDATPVAFANDIHPSTGTLYIGDGCYTAVDYLGNIGEVRIYNRALTPLEIQRNYLATKWRYR